MDVRSAELTTFAANAMLATKISFMNEVSRLADAVGADVELVRQGMGSDPRIGYQFIYPGCGYGGSCFPKDVQALAHTANKHGLDASLINATHAVNEQQKRIIFDKLKMYFNENLRGKRIAIWGLAFKPNTDDIREAPSIYTIEQLLKSGASVCAYDPEAMKNVKCYFGESEQISYAACPYGATEGADVLVIMTEWMEFRSPNFERLQSQLNLAAIFDGRNLYSPHIVARNGLDYFCIGRPKVNRLEVESCV
jgi:nucleotide sugar dehydrogenase